MKMVRCWRSSSERLQCRAQIQICIIKLPKKTIATNLNLEQSSKLAFWPASRVVVEASRELIVNLFVTIEQRERAALSFKSLGNPDAHVFDKLTLASGRSLHFV